MKLIFLLPSVYCSMKLSEVWDRSESLGCEHVYDCVILSTLLPWRPVTTRFFCLSIANLCLGNFGLFGNFWEQGLKFPLFGELD